LQGDVFKIVPTELLLLKNLWLSSERVLKAASS
jgi:hypothetical protein